MPLSVLQALVAAAWTLDWRWTAILLLLGFHCLLRPGELVALHRCHLRLPCDAHYAVPSGVVSIVRPKTRNRGAKVQGVIIEDQPLLSLLDAFWGDLPKATLLCGGGRPGLVKRFEHLKFLLHLEQSALSLGSLRAGGAVHFVSTGGAVGELQFRGRWDAPTTLLHYVQQASAVSVLFDASPTALAMIAHLSTVVSTLLCNDPKVVSGRRAGSSHF